MDERKLKVFLCHASQDKPIVREMYYQLRTEGWIDPWLDEEKLLPGQDWDFEIEKAVLSADIVIVFMSTNAVSKEGYIQKELRFILNVAEYKPEGKIYVIPLRLEDCEMPRRLLSLQYLDYFPQEKKRQSYNRLVASLAQKRYAYVKLGLDKKLGDYFNDCEDLPEEIRFTLERIENDGFVSHQGLFLAKPDILIRDLLNALIQALNLDVVAKYELEMRNDLFHQDIGKSGLTICLKPLMSKFDYEMQSLKDDYVPSNISLNDIHLFSSIEKHLESSWAISPSQMPYTLKSAKIGMSTYMEPFDIDINSGRDSDGIILGVPGWGKNELLCTTIVALSVENHPYFLNFLFFDVQGKRFFETVDLLPHSLGRIKHGDDARLQNTINMLWDESRRRQKLFNAQRCEDIDEYHKHLFRVCDFKLSNIKKELLSPHLVIVVDNVEMLGKDVLTELFAFRRISRSLGFHLILSSEVIGDTLDEEMIANLNFRIVLKVNSEYESKKLLYTRDAAHLTLPGRALFRGYLVSRPRQFQVARSLVKMSDVNNGDSSYPDNTTLAESLVAIMKNQYIKGEFFPLQRLI